MTRKSLTVLVAALVAMPGAAHAGTPSQPVIDQHPHVVEFRSSFEITGHAGDASTGQTVHLERRAPYAQKWTGIAKQTIGKSPTFTFVVEDVRQTRLYRVRVDEAVSEEVRVGVRARLTLKPRRPDLMKGDVTRLTGLLRPALEDRTVLLEERVAGEWRPVGRALVEDGRFSLPARFDRSGYRHVRATFEKDAVNEQKRSRTIVRVHRPSLATWYGPGFFGNRTACGQKFTRRTIGVAHRKLPCGTRVHVLFKGATIALEVIDRGPFTDANWDLSQRAARKIGFYGKEDIGVLVRRV